MSQSPYRAADDAHLEEERAAERVLFAAVEEAKSLRLQRLRSRGWAALALSAALSLVAAAMVLVFLLEPFVMGAILVATIVIGLFAAIVVLSGRIPPRNGNTSVPMYPGSS